MHNLCYMYMPVTSLKSMYGPKIALSGALPFSKFASKYMYILILPTQNTSAVAIQAIIGSQH